MRVKTWCGFVSFLLLAAPCYGAGYDHFSAGMGAQDRGDVNRAAAEFTAAIEAGDLNAELLPTAYMQRGIANLGRRDCPDAAKDAASALQLKPDYRDALALQAGADECLGNFAAAIANYRILTASSPSAELLGMEALAFWRSGDFASAQQPLAQAIAIAPKPVNLALLLAVVRARAGNAAQSPPVRLDEDDWPAPVLALFAGTSNPDAVMAAAGKGGPPAVALQTCQANFYVAEWWLAQKQMAKAWPLFAQAATKCPGKVFERGMAGFELTHPQGTVP